MEPRILVLLALAATATAGPVWDYTLPTTTQCAKECPQRESNKLNYAPGTTYMYDYHASTETSVTGASEDSAKMTISAVAEVEVISPCEMALKLRDSRFFHSDIRGDLRAADREDHMKSLLEAKSLRFSFQNGEVRHICPVDEEEDVWVMNVKKGVLSAFQNRMDDPLRDQNVTETDVAGTCETSYKTQSNGYYTVTVIKNKDILTCTNRHDFHTMVRMVPYSVPSEIQSLPVMKTTHQCTHDIQKGGVLEQSVCYESHIYRPFSNGKSGASTIVTQTLKLQTYRKDVSTSQGAILRRDSLLYQHSSKRMNEENQEKSRDQTKRILKGICQSSAYDARPESPTMFSDLVASLRILPLRALQQILGDLKRDTLCPENDKALKSFLDALPATGTSESVSLMVDLIHKEEIKDLQAKAWIASLAFVQKPTLDMLKDVKKLVDNKSLRNDAMLPVSTMIHNVCDGMKKCSEESVVRDILSSLVEQLGHNCKTYDKDVSEILLALRAVGNAGHNNEVIPTINACLAEDSNPLEVRIAAANAFRRTPCDAEGATLWQTYNNRDLDSELRISSYLAIVRCPDDVTLNKIVSSLDTEEDGHVGAFVYTHLMNIKESSDPHKENVARALDKLVIPDKFETNPLKASNNLEASALLNKINTGFVAESNLIWSSTTQMPRSVSANFTVELFGQSVNLFDFGGRLEGLEHLLKSLLGPRMGGKDKGSDKDITGSVYGRIFGNEMLFAHSDQVKKSDFEVSKLWMDMIKSLSKEKDFTFSHSVQLIDTRVVIPTMAGLPVYLTVNGSVVADLVLGGKINLLGMKKSPISMDIEGEIRPSAALTLTGSMFVHLADTKSGLRMRNTLHSSTYLKGHVLVEGGEVLSVQLDTPKDKMEIFDFSSKFFIIHDKIEQEQNMITSDRKQIDICSWDKMADITGAVLCGHVSYTNASMQEEGPYFPLTGPTSASLILRKTDTHSGYKLIAKRIANKKTSNIQISFNTPGSRVNRVILVDMSMDNPSKSIDANIVTPWKKAALTGALVNKKSLKSMTGTLTVDASDVYGITTEVKINQNKRKLHLTPMIEIRQPGMQNVQLTGSVALEGALKNLDVDLSVSGLQRLPLNLKTSVTNTKKETSLKASVSEDGDKTRYSVEASSRAVVSGKKTTLMHNVNTLKISTPQRSLVSLETSADYKEDKSLRLEGSIDIHSFMKKPASIKVDIVKNERKRSVRYDIDANVKSTTISGRVDSNLNIKDSRYLSIKSVIDFTIPKVIKDKIIFSGKLADRSTKAYTKYSAKSNLEMKKNPEYNLGLDLSFDNKKKHSKASLEMKYGPNFKDDTKTVKLGYELAKKIVNYRSASLNYIVNAEAPEHKIDVQLSGKHEHNPKTVDSDVTLYFWKKQFAKANVFLKDKSKKFSNLNGHATVAWPGNEYTLSSKLDQRASKHFVHEIKLKEKDGAKHSIESVYKNIDIQAFSSEINLEGLRKLVVSGSAKLQGSTPHASAEVTYGKDTYGVSTKSKLSQKNGAVYILELLHPDRRVLLRAEGENSKNKYESHIEALWDADKDKSQKMVLDMTLFEKSARDIKSVGGGVTFRSPFENFEKLGGSMRYDIGSSKHDVSGKLSWGGKHKQINGVLSVKKPISLSYLEGSVEIDTPFKIIKQASGEIKHDWNKASTTTINGQVNKKNAKLVVQGHGGLNGLEGKVTFESNIKHAEDVSMHLKHQMHGGKIESSASMNNNKRSYGYDLRLVHTKDGWAMKNDGELVLSSPKSKASFSWQHANDEHKVKSSLTSRWGKKEVNIKLTGSHDVSSTREVEGTLEIDTPWKAMDNVVVELKHKHGLQLIDSKAVWVQNSRTKASTNVQYKRSKGKTNLEFEVKSPFHHDISGKLDTLYNSYPEELGIFFQWHPQQKITVVSQLKADKWDGASFDVKLTTPLEDLQALSILASNENERGETVSRFNLNYGPDMDANVETRFSYGELKKTARIRVSTPIESFKYLDSGVDINGQLNHFDGSADFETAPLVGKLHATTSWRQDPDFRGSLRLDTPYADYSFFEISGSSKDNGDARKSHVEVKYHPRQVYSLDTLYSSKLPIKFEATINTPHKQYKDVGVVFQHNHDSSKVISHGEIKYASQKSIQGDLDIDWASDMHGSLIVKTHIPGYENNKIAFNHQGQLEDFTSRAEVHVAEKSVVADASFKSGYTTTGMVSLTSPIPGMESISLNVEKKGRARNLRGSVTLVVNNDKIDADYFHKLTQQGVKGRFKLITPFMDDIKLKLEFDGGLEKFHNEISASYSRKYTFNSDVSFEHDHPVMTGESIFKYKIENRENELRVGFNRKGEIDDISIEGRAAFNNDEIKVEGSMDTKNDLAGSLLVTSTFDGFKRTGLTISHAGLDDGFRSSAKMHLLDDKVIDGKLTLFNDGQKHVQIESEINTPFEQLPSVSLTLNQNFDERDKIVNGEVALKTPVAKFGSGSFTYDKVGDLRNLVITTSVKRNGRKLATIKLNNFVEKKQVHSKVEAEIVDYPELQISLDHVGDIENFESKALAKFGEEQLHGEISRQGPIDALSISGSVGYNRDVIDLTGSLNSQRGIDANIEIRTPFEKYNTIGMSISRSGDISDLKSSASIQYMDDKIIKGKFDITTKDALSIVSVLDTPFDGLESTKLVVSGPYDLFKKDINAKVLLSSTVKRFGVAEAAINKNENLDKLVVDGSILRNNIELCNIQITNENRDKTINSALRLKGTIVPNIDATLEHSGSMSKFDTKARASVDNEEVFSNELSLNMKGKRVVAGGSLQYNIATVGTNQASLRVEKDGELDDIVLSVDGELNGDKYVLDGKMNLKSDISGHLTIKTPMERYNNVGISFSHNGDFKNFVSEGKINLVDDDDFSGKIEFSRDELRSLDMSVEIKTPIDGVRFTKFEQKHKNQDDSLKCFTSLQYGDSKTVSLDVSAAHKPNIDVSVNIKTPFDKYEDLLASVKVEKTWPKVSIYSKLNAGNDQKFTLDGDLDVSPDLNGHLALSTPLDRFSNVGISFGYSGKLKDFKSDASLRYMDGKEIAGDIEFKFVESFLAAELRSPFSGFEKTSYEYKYTPSSSESSVNTKLMYGNGKVVSIDSVVTFKPRPGFDLTIKTPVQDYEVVKASSSFEASWKKFELKSKVDAGIDREVILDATLEISKEIVGYVELKTPMDKYSNVGLNFRHSGDYDKFDTSGKLTYMDGKDIIGKVSFYKYMWRRLVASAELSTPFDIAKNTKAEVSYEGNSNSMTTSGLLVYGDEQKIDATLKLAVSPTYEAIVTINTPISDYQVIHSRAFVDTTAPSYKAGYNINYADNVYSVNGKMNVDSVDKVDGSVEIVLPIKGVEFSKIEYRHELDVNQIASGISLTYDNGKTMSGEFKATNALNYDASVIIKTPFEGYENMEGSFTYDDSYNKHEASGSLNLGAGNLFALSSELDISSEPIHATIKMSTPHADYRNIELALTKEGQLKDFHVTGLLTTPVTNRINAEATVKFDSFFEMEAAASVKSSFKGMDDLLVEIRNSGGDKEKRSHVIAGWTSGQQIVLDGSFRKQNGWYEDQIVGDVSMTTPFELLSSLSGKVEHSGKPEESSQTISLEINGDKLLDMDTTIISKDKQSASVTFRSPQSMKYSVESTKKAGLLDTEIEANWDRNSINKNVRILASVNDKSDSYKTDRSVDISLEHSSRKVGLTHELRVSNKDLASSGKLFWDSGDSNKISYDLELKDVAGRRKDIRDVHLAVGLPSRTLKLAGSCSDNKVNKVTDVTLNWDADRSDKQIGFKSKMSRGDRIQGDIALTMPGIKQEIRVDGDLMSNKKHLSLDSKTAISLSLDERRSLTLTSKLEGSATYNNNFNYSLAMGMLHPYTNVDIQLASHLANSEEKMTVGLSTYYLTASRQNKNIGLLAEINKIKKQMSLKITNPIKKVEVVGKVLSTRPYKAQVTTLINDVETTRSDLTIDGDKKVIELGLTEGSQGVKLMAGYLNSTAFEAHMHRFVFGRERTDALLAVRLNNTRLMHTRLHWNPDLLFQLKDSIQYRVADKKAMVDQMIKEVNAAVFEELFAKHLSIKTFIKDDVRPILDSLYFDLMALSFDIADVGKKIKQDKVFGQFEATQIITNLVMSGLLHPLQFERYVISQIWNKLEDFTNYPVAERYAELTAKVREFVFERMHFVGSDLNLYLAEIESILEEYYNAIQRNAKDSVINATYVPYIADRIRDIDVRSYAPSLKVPQKYQAIFSNVHDAINSNFGDIMDAPGLKFVKVGTNEVYQQGLWAYNYWQVEKNMLARLDDILELIAAIIQEELKELVSELNPITVWDPAHGEIQADLPLPVDVHSLDELPDVYPDLFPLANDIIELIPDANTLRNIYKYVPRLNVLPPVDDDVLAMSKSYRPSKPSRRHWFRSSPPDVNTRSI